LTKSPYIRRLEERNRNDFLKRQIVLGLVIGWLAILVGAFTAFFVPGANEFIWKLVLWAGMILLGVSVVLPSLLYRPEKWWSYGASALGKLIFSTALLLAYFLMFWTAGILLRWRKGNQGFYTWKETIPQLTTAWKPYDAVEDTAQTERGGWRQALLFQPLWVLVFFARRGHYLFIPVLVFLLLLGLAMFFAQTSSLAPFIYTLF
jgi:hypothetical protein